MFVMYYFFLSIITCEKCETDENVINQCFLGAFWLILVFIHKCLVNWNSVRLSSDCVRGWEIYVPPTKEIL